MSDYAVKITIKNARILRLMRSAGIDTVAELSRRSGVPQTELGKIIGLKKSPTLKDGQWASAVERMSAILRCDPEDMFTDAQSNMELKTNSHEVEMGEPEVMALTAGESMEDSSWARIEAQRLLAGLGQREREIVEGMMQGGTYAEVGAEHNISVERARQIEQKALRKMRARTAISDKACANELAILPRFKPNPDWKPREVREAEQRKAELEAYRRQRLFGIPVTYSWATR